MKLRIKPLTHKMKNRVREHGDIWNVRPALWVRDTKEINITVPPNSGEDYKYGIWVTPGKEVEIVEEIND